MTAKSEVIILLRMSLNRNDITLSKSPWIARLAAAGYLFFLIKGLVWLAVAGGAVLLAT